MLLSSKAFDFFLLEQSNSVFEIGLEVCTSVIRWTSQFSSGLASYLCVLNAQFTAQANFNQQILLYTKSTIDELKLLEGAKKTDTSESISTYRSSKKQQFNLRPGKSINTF